MGLTPEGPEVNMLALNGTKLLYRYMVCCLVQCLNKNSVSKAAVTDVS